LSDFLTDIDAVLLATRHKEFKELNEKDFKKYNVKIVVDGKNLYDKQAFLNADIIYKGIGRG